MMSSVEDDVAPLIPNSSGNGNRRKDHESNNYQVQNNSGHPDSQPIAGIQAYVTVIILFMVNLLNYVDRYTVAANLSSIQTYFSISDNNSAAGLLQTVFILGYMVTSPVFGYLGDRYSRKFVISGGILMWSGLTFAGSLVGPDSFWLFLLIRGLVGIGEASYVTIAATLIGDLFVGSKRTNMLMVFYFAIPVGSGFGYIAGKGIADIFGSWQWALRFTPVLGLVSVFLIVFVVKEPNRGQAETGNNVMEHTSYVEDLKQLVKNKSYIFSSFGLTCQCWVSGALALWAVSTIELAYTLQGMNSDSVSYIFGALTCIAGIVGVGGGTTAAKLMRPFNPRADPLVCASGMLAGAPFLLLGVFSAPLNVYVSWVFILIAEILLFLNWALIPDILLYVLIPTRRATGNGLQMLMSHLLGDALSPWIVGFVSDQIRQSMTAPNSVSAQFYSLSYALYLAVFVSAIGGGFFLATAMYIEAGKKRVEDIVKGST